MRILFVGGGTAGSVTPLLAVWERLRADHPKARAWFVGTRMGPERLLCDSAQIQFFSIVAGKFPRYLTLQWIIEPFRLIAGFLQSLVLVGRLRPDVISGSGSYVQVPVMLAGRLFGTRIATHQQDLRTGLANRLVFPFAQLVTYALKDAPIRERPRALWIGNPVRRSVQHTQSASDDPILRFPKERPLLVVLGGGTGAHQINELVQKNIDALLNIVNIIHSTGRGKSGLLSKVGYHAVPFLTDALPSVLHAATVVVSRAGMGTLSELGVVSKATVVLPLPGTHQEENAAYLAERNAAEVIPGKTLHGEKLIAVLQKLIADPERRSSLGKSLHRVFPEGASERLAIKLWELQK